MTMASSFELVSPLLRLVYNCVPVVPMVLVHAKKKGEQRGQSSAAPRSDLTIGISIRTWLGTRLQERIHAEETLSSFRSASWMHDVSL